MAINPIAITQPQAYSGGIDWSPLDRLGEQIIKARQEAEAAQLIAQLYARGGGEPQLPGITGTTPSPAAPSPQRPAIERGMLPPVPGYNIAGNPAAAPPAAAPAAPGTALSPDAMPPWLQSALAGNYNPAAPQPAVDPRSPIGRALGRIGYGPSTAAMPAPFPAAGAPPVPGLPPNNAVSTAAWPPPNTPLPPFPEGGTSPIIASPGQPAELPPWARNATVGGNPGTGFPASYPFQLPPEVPEQAPTIPATEAPPPPPMSEVPLPRERPVQADVFPIVPPARAPAAPIEAAPPVPYTQAGLDRALGVIRQKESSNNYGNVTTTRNPRTGQLQSALGAYGVMDFNVGPWTKEALGRELTREEFLRNSAAQDAVARLKFGQYADRYGLSGAARAWLAGPGGMNKNVADAFGTTPMAYADDFNRKLGLPPEITAGTSRPAETSTRAMALDATQAAAAPATTAAAQPVYNRIVQNLGNPQASAAAADISSEELAALYRNPVTRPIAAAFLQKRLDPGTYKFMAAGDNIVRYNERTGQYDMLPMQNKPMVVGKKLVDPNTGKVIYGGDDAYPDDPSPGFRWVDPKDKSKGEIAIAGGPGTQLPAEVAAKIGLGRSFLNNLPSIKQRLEGDVLGIDVNPTGHLAAVAGVGPGAETKRQIESGADSLLRMLTGAGMGIQEATDYAMRYRPTARDTKEQLLSKMAQLENEIHSTAELIGQGRGGSPLAGVKRSFGAQTEAAPAAPAAPAAGPSPGTALQLQVGKVYYGRPYKGGPPHDPKSWGARVQ